LQGWSNW